MKNIVSAISGNKTYIIAGATILYAILGIVLHFLTIPTGLTVIGSLGSIAALRLGVAKVQGILEIVLELLQVINQLPAPVEPVQSIEPVQPVQLVQLVEPTVPPTQ